MIYPIPDNILVYIEMPRRVGRDLVSYTRSRIDVKLVATAPDPVEFIMGAIRPHVEALLQMEEDGPEEGES